MVANYIFIFLHNSKIHVHNESSLIVKNARGKFSDSMYIDFLMYSNLVVIFFEVVHVPVTVSHTPFLN